MVNLNKVEQDYKDILLNLSPEEITTYYEKFNEKIFETYPTTASSFFDVEEMLKLEDNLEDVTDILKTKYPYINVVNYITKFKVLNDKYLEENDLAVYKLLATDINTIVGMISYLVTFIEGSLMSIYSYYEFATGIGTSILSEELNVPEELLEPLEPYFYNKENTSFYGAKALSWINLDIESNLTLLNEYLKLFEGYTKINYNPEEVPEDLQKVLNCYNKIYEEGLEYKAKLEELKANPFRKAIETSVEVKKKMNEELDKHYKEVFNEEPVYKPNYESMLENKIASAPSYNFETFELEFK